MTKIETFVVGLFVGLVLGYWLTYAYIFVQRIMIGSAS